MNKAFAFAATGALMTLAACGQSADPTNSSTNATVIPADQAEQELMANGFSGERSSDQPATGESTMGTTGQANVSGAAPSGGTGSNARPSAGTPKDHR